MKAFKAILCSSCCLTCLLHFFYRHVHHDGIELYVNSWEINGILYTAQIPIYLCSNACGFKFLRFVYVHNFFDNLSGWFLCPSPNLTAPASPKWIRKLPLPAGLPVVASFLNSNLLCHRPGMANFCVNIKAMTLTLAHPTCFDASPLSGLWSTEDASAFSSGEWFVDHMTIQILR